MSHCRSFLDMAIFYPACFFIIPTLLLTFSTAQPTFLFLPLVNKNGWYVSNLAWMMSAFDEVNRTYPEAMQNFSWTVSPSKDQQDETLYLLDLVQSIYRLPSLQSKQRSSSLRKVDPVIIIGASKQLLSLLSNYLFGTKIFYLVILIFSHY